ncbi:MAG: peptidoglycan editing factor PgeF [Rubellimicrobium sp.]|nr:peptidoglycan editing factor PgeF [Rubellimicrobium sp.]
MTLDIITHDALAPFRHGFFGRQGGASSGVFAGLNCGFASSDQQEAVAINRARVAGALGLEVGALAGVHQVHSATAVVLGDDPLARPVADALVTDRPGIALTVLTADCQPVLFADARAGVIGAAHAGWKGALGGVLEATVAAMEGLGARAADTVAIIGPTISQRAYEVGPEFLERFMTEDEGAARWFANGTGGRYLFDLPGYGLHRLRRAGVGLAEWTRHCTLSDPARFFSYRRATLAQEADYGRMIAAIAI